MRTYLKRILRKLRKWQNVNHQSVFSNIYSKKVWGNDGDSVFYSGTGSDEPYAKPYADVVTGFIKENNITSVVDLGCGDFRIGRLITQANNVKYTGVDVVPDLIKHNALHFSNERTNFLRLNIVKDTLPPGEMCLIRQVLQHLSNTDIQKILKKCKQYRYVIITEHHPIGENIVANHDKPPDESIRLSWNSGVFLDQPPFNKKVEELLTVFPKIEKNSKIVTFRVFV